MVSEGKSKTFLALTSQFSIFYSPEQDKNKAEGSFLFIFIFRKRIQCHLALNLEMSSDVERQHCAVPHYIFHSQNWHRKKSVRFGRKEWNRAVSHGAACGCDCSDGHRGRSHLPAGVGLPPLLLSWLSFPPPWWPVMAHTLHHHHAQLQPALLLRAIACRSRERPFIFSLSH